MQEETTTLDPIAIIGMSLKVPGADSLDQYWHNLKNGIESIKFFTDEELKNAGIKQAIIDDPNYIKAFGQLKDIDKFDAYFFDITPREAQILDPQHRLFLECSWEVLENAGYDPDKYDGRIGVFAGAGLNNYLIKNLMSNPEYIDYVGGWAMIMGNDKDFMPTRASYKFNLKGPSINTSTGCSTSLVAIAMGCQSLLSYQSDMIIAGGVTIQLPQDRGYFYDQGGIMSPDGHCRAFDAKAQGTVDGNGIGIVLLKRYEDAVSDGDHIYALIKGFAVNNDGSDKVGFTAPSVNGQSDVVTEAIEMAEIDPETISFIEAHGSGTNLGDPIEVTSLIQSFKLFTSKKNFCALGSVKTNLGHLDAAAGVASFIKAVLALKNKQIPPTLHFEKPNPEIDFENSPFYVNNTLIDWKTNNSPRRAGVSSLGIGGTNAHVILEESPYIDKSGKSRPYYLLTMSAKSSNALDKISQNLAVFLQNNQDTNMADIAYTLSSGRKFFEHKQMLVCKSSEEAIEYLLEKKSQNVYTNFTEKNDSKVVFMFPGMGAEYKNMTKQLYEDELAFREILDQCARLIKDKYNLDLLENIWDDQTTATILPRPIDKLYAPVALFIIEYCLAKLWMSYGVMPEAMIGYSGGEYVSACLAEVLSLEDAVSFIVESGKQTQNINNGSMLAILKSEKFVSSLLNDKLFLAAVNGVSLCLISGANEEVDNLQDKLAKQNIMCYRIPTLLAYHSNMMEPIVEPLLNKLKKVKLNKPKIRWISSVTGTWITDDEATDPNYYVKKIILNPVRFIDSLSTIFKNPELILLEVGPGQILSPFAKQHPDWPHKEQIVLSTLKAPQYALSETKALFTTLGQLWLSGVPVNWKKFYQNEKRFKIPLPTYPFEKESYWVEPKQVSGNFDAYLSQESFDKKENIGDWFYLPSWNRSHISLKQSNVKQQIENQNWIIFLDQHGIGDQIISHFSNKNVKIITIKKGNLFNKINENSYTLNNSNYDDYDKLFQSLKDITIHNIVHLWQISNDINDYSQIMNNGFYSILFLGQALGKHCFSSLILTVISNKIHDITGDEKICPEKAAVLGPLKVIPQEFQNINCRSIDIILHDKGSDKEKKLITHIISELSIYPTHRSLAFRGNHCWYQTYENFRLERPDHLNLNHLIRENGVYLITGGLGNIGLLFAEFLLKKFKCKLILVCRSKMPPKDKWNDWINTHEKKDRTSQRILKIRKLEESGENILIGSANAADFNEMNEIVKQAERKFGNINGVIHAAGIVDEASICTISDINVNECEKHFEAKIHGTRVIEKIFKNKNIDFCFLFSSLSCILGGIGFSAYSAANIFLDNFVDYHNHKEHDKWLCVNWEAWNFQKSDKEKKDSDFGASIDALAIEPDEGIDAFERLCFWSEPFNRLIISPGNLQARIDEWVEFDSIVKDDDSKSKKFHKRPNLLNPYTEPVNETEKKLVEIWEYLLGISPIGIYDNFFELGGNSLLLTQLISKVRKTFQIGITIKHMFDEPDIESLAKTIDLFRLKKTLKKNENEFLEEREVGEI